MLLRFIFYIGKITANVLLSSLSAFHILKTKKIAFIAFQITAIIKKQVKKVSHFGD